MSRISRFAKTAALLLVLGVAGCDYSEDSATSCSSYPTWPQWGGPRGDFQVSVDTLASTWPGEGPRQLWSRALGEGYSGIVSVRGTLYTMYRDWDKDVVIALRAEDGETLWEESYVAPTRTENETQFGEGPNATPLIVGDRLVTLGYTGVLSALDLETGAPLWRRDLLEEFDGTVLGFGYSASPILHDGKVIVLVGGASHAVVAFDPGDGSVAWGSDPGGVSYATPSVIHVDGQDQLVYHSATELVGLDASTGEALWRHPCANQYMNNATGTLWGDDGLLWVPTQLDGGTRVLRLSRDAGRTDVSEVWSSAKISIHFWNSIRIGDHVYASIGGHGSILAAIDVRTGEVAWRERGYEKANLIHAGDRTVLLDGEGNLALVRLSPDGMETLAQARIVDGVTWTAPTLLGTRLFVRDKKSIRAIELGPEGSESGAPGAVSEKKSRERA